MLVKVNPHMLKKSRKPWQGTYRWAKNIDLRKVVRVLSTQEHVFCSIESLMKPVERALFATSLNVLRNAVCESKEGRQLLGEEEQDAVKDNPDFVSPS